MAHLSLFELNALLKRTLDENLEMSYWVVAEIGEMRLNQKGHCYMELVEKEGNFISAKIRANIWSYTYRTISSSFEATAQTPLRSGLKVLFNVSVQFHEVYGLSLNVKDIDPNFTLGERARKRKEVIQRLVDEGIFEQNKRLTLPEVPQKIAVISSESAAGYGDFISQLAGNDRGLAFHTTLFQALMQGDQAPSSIVKALNEIREQVRQYSLVVIIRGGGGQLDLDCFDDYELAASVAQFPLPIVTGIGHERDETITDLVAHTKIKTPTALADFLISGLISFEDKLDEAMWRIHQSVTNEISLARMTLNQTAVNLKLGVVQHLQEAHGRIGRKSDVFIYRSQEALKTNHQKLDHNRTVLLDKSSSYLIRQSERLTNFEKELSLVEPTAVLKRGYTVSRIKGKLLKNTEMKSGEEMQTEYDGGTILSTIKKSNNE